jgi:hypothetical protein
LRDEKLSWLVGGRFWPFRILNNRLIQVCDRLLSPNQTTFIKGRYILESVVPDHEVIHEIAMGKDSSVILKLDYEKAYDRINWNFLEEFLISRGFSNKWVT